jgi:beta-galactosidase/beta-glucuronidase
MSKQQSETMHSIPRPEHPRPQFVRDSWINLNGRWTFALDPGRSGGHAGREWQRSTGFDRSIVVPFCPESRLSGVGHADFIDAIWYHRKVRIPKAWAGKRILLHAGGIDFESGVFVDGVEAGRHYGGSAGFTVDLTSCVRPGATHHLVIHATDDVRSGKQPAGKQSGGFKSAGCHYTRTTGIWQTVWLEAAGSCGLESVHVVPDLDGSRFVLTPAFYALEKGLRWRATLSSGTRRLARAEGAVGQGMPLVLPVECPIPWSPEDPFLYDLTFEVLRGDVVVDAVRSYAGLRKVHIEGNRLFLNNKPLYLRLVLDQGFYPDGIWTAPDDAALKRDIELSMAAGFNGARLHQKVFEERFHYWADRLGYLTWGEYPSWGLGVFSERGQNVAADSAWSFLAEWREIVARDRNHPSIIAWTPFNETHAACDWNLHRRLHRDAYELTRALDPTRPVNDASGYVHVKTDLWTVHTYEQDPAKLKAQLATDPETGVFRNFPDREVPYEGQPYLVDEFGGIKWIPPERRAWADNSWGYGEGPKTLKAFYERLEGQVDAILAQPHVSGYCYTQLTDVEQEQNGIFNYDRSPKFDMKRLSRLFSRIPEGFS